LCKLDLNRVYIYILPESPLPSPLPQEVTRDWAVRSGVKQRKVHLIVTPAVVREVRAHFDCPDLEGAELEDQVKA
jgi:hypothetical protein